jgi:hypothetical protein
VNIEHHASDGAKLAIDVLSGFVVLGTLASILPPLAALLTIIWTVIRIWETETVKGWRGKRSRPDSEGK